MQNIGGQQRFAKISYVKNRQFLQKVLTSANTILFSKMRPFRDKGFNQAICNKCFTISKLDFSEASNYPQGTNITME